jgi:hypothetical protein
MAEFSNFFSPASPGGNYYNLSARSYDSHDNTLSLYSLPRTWPDTSYLAQDPNAMLAPNRVVIQTTSGSNANTMHVPLSMLLMPDDIDVVSSTHDQFHSMSRTSSTTDYMNANMTHADNHSLLATRQYFRSQGEMQMHRQAIAQGAPPAAMENLALLNPAPRRPRSHSSRNVALETLVISPAILSSFFVPSLIHSTEPSLNQVTWNVNGKAVNTKALFAAKLI